MRSGVELFPAESAGETLVQLYSWTAFSRRGFPIRFAYTDASLPYSLQCRRSLPFINGGFVRLHQHKICIPMTRFRLRSACGHSDCHSADKNTVRQRIVFFLSLSLSLSLSLPLSVCSYVCVCVCVRSVTITT